MLQYVGFSAIYAELFNNNKAKRLVQYSVVPFCVLSIFSTVFVQHIDSVPSYILMLMYVVFILYALSLFMHMLSEPQEMTIFKQGVFWYNSAMLVYSVFQVVSLGMIDYLIKHKLFTFPLRVFLYSTTVLYYLILGISIYLDNKRKPV
jgi:hypothetical protein